MTTTDQNVILGAALTPHVKNPAAVALGRLGGLVGGKAKSPAKTAANRINARKGGRPKGSKTHKPTP